MTNEDSAWPNRPQRRYLRRIYNGRTVPILVNDIEFLTYKQAMKYLQALDEESCNHAAAQMKIMAEALDKDSKLAITAETTA